VIWFETRTILFKIDLDVIYVAPAPLLTGLERAYQRMLSRVKMFGRVFVPRRVAATHVAADETQSQVNPSISRFQALLTTLRVRMNVLNFI
jgi:hypothetical protein